MSIMWHVKYNPRMHEWRVYDENWYYVAGYETHAEALAYADQQARTVTLVLPSIEVSPINTSYGTTINRAEQIPLSTPAPDQWGQRLEAEHGKKGPTIRLNGPYGSIYWCSWDDVKTTALHLLALHYHHERNQK